MTQREKIFLNIYQPITDFVMEVAKKTFPKYIKRNNDDIVSDIYVSILSNMDNVHGNIVSVKNNVKYIDFYFVCLVLGDIMFSIKEKIKNEKLLNEDILTYVINEVNSHHTEKISMDDLAEIINLEGLGDINNYEKEETSFSNNLDEEIDSSIENTDHILMKFINNHNDVDELNLSEVVKLMDFFKYLNNIL